MQVLNRWRKDRRAWLIGGGVALFLILQFGFPAGRVLPRTNLGNESVGYKSKQQVVEDLKLESQTVKLSFNGKTHSYKANETGLSADVNTTASLLPTLSFTDRLVPFKPLYRALQRQQVEVVTIRDDEQLEVFARRMSEEHTVAPVNAKAEVRDGKVTIAAEKSGRAYSAADIQRTLQQKSAFSAPITLPVKTMPAEVTRTQLEPLKEEYVKKSRVPLKIIYGTTTKTISTEELQKLLDVRREGDESPFKIGFHPERLNAYLQTWAKDYNIAPGITQVTYHDDVETARSNGASGRALDEEKVRAQLAGWLDQPAEEPITLATKVLPAKVVANRTYSRTSAGLQRQLDAWVQANRGRYQIAIYELGGKGRTASHNVAQQTVMASTYKPFLAFAAYKQAESGALDLNASMGNGRNIEQCIEVMVVRSDNDCPVRLGRYIGWAKVDQIIAASGFQGVKLNNYNASGAMVGDKMVNAQEQVKFLAQLSAGQLIGSGNTAKLIGYMKRDIYSQGIPAGSRGAPVAHKVGFLDNYLHDVGIVYGPRSTYALVIMSEGSSWANVRNLAQAVYDFMNDPNP